VLQRLLREEQKLPARFPREGAQKADLSRNIFARLAGLASPRCTGKAADGNRKLRAARVRTLAEFLRINDGAEHSPSSEDVFARARFDLEYQKAALVLPQS
jgi:hypothetical protein